MPVGGLALAVAFPEASPERWFAARCRFRQEAIAKVNLRRQGFGVYLPLIKIGRRVGSKGWAEMVEPLFPGYLFVRFAPGLKSGAPIRSTKGVLGLVRFGAEPAVVPDVAISALQARENSSGLHVDRSARLAPGDKVQLTEGPFSGLLASYSEREGNNRVVILLEAMGALHRLTVPRASIARI